MKVTNYLSIFFFLLLTVINSSVAQPKDVEGLQIGDKIPNQIMTIINKYQGKEKKMIIISFWATWCKPCLKELKILDSLARENEKDLLVLSVSYQSQREIESFLSKNPEYNSSSLQFLMSDKILHSYFPHRVLPHNIWIDNNKKIKYITGGAEINRENILSFIKGEKDTLFEKKDKIHFDTYEPFHLSDSKFRYRAILTDHIEGLLSGFTVQNIGNIGNRKIIRFFSFNQYKANLFWYAINEGRSPKDFYNTMRVETKDSLRFFWTGEESKSFANSKYKTRQDWRSKNTFCYELRLPEAVDDTVFYKNMLDDLKRNFNVDIGYRNEIITCGVITLNKKYKAPIDQDSAFLDLDDKRIVAKNISVFYLMNFLNERLKDDLNDIPSDPPYVDKTNDAKIDVDIVFEGESNKLNYIKEVLKRKYGVNVDRKKHKYRITILKDLES
ncbi:putative Redoxin domain protein [Sphingobacterium sp. PM2-P1-29]|nr:putative Redoxin domain protein [Sphingobacterium sp. PM2-P1-29]